MRKELAGVGLFIFSFSLVFLRLCFEDASSAPHVPGGVSEEKELDEDSIAAFNKYASEVLHPRRKSPPSASHQNLNSFISTTSNANLSISQLQSVSVWKYFKHLTTLADLPLEHAKEAISDAAFAWKGLLGSLSNSDLKPASQDECGFSVEWKHSRSRSYETNRGFKKKISIPCGLAVDSSITLAGVPGGDFFRIKLVNSTAGVHVFDYLVRLTKSSSGPVIVQSKGDGSFNQTCPATTRASRKKVDGLEICSQKSFSKRMVGEKKHARSLSSDFPFTTGLPFVATLRLGSHGFHMACNGKHITSFRYHQDQKPWLVNSVEIEGDVNVFSLLATGLPVSESHKKQLPHTENHLKAPPVSKTPQLVVGVFSTANNLKRRMAIRRSWMQYEDVKSGAVVVRFFIGLDKNLTVNSKLWNEATSFQDMQLLPFVDQYELITLKTLAICIFGMKVVKSRFLMKTDDDTFVRIDEILSLIKVNPSTPFLLGLIEFSAQPNRDESSKWYISEEEWNHHYYPPWPHGAGYVISREVARHVVEAYESSSLKLFKLEDVAMGIWISDYTKTGKHVEYVTHDKFFNLACEPGYVIAHYQHPQQMLCLWQQLSGGRGALCC